MYIFVKGIFYLNMLYSFNGFNSKFLNASFFIVWVVVMENNDLFIIIPDVEKIDLMLLFTA